MAIGSKHDTGLANPEKLAAFGDDKSAIVVIIERPKGSGNNTLSMLRSASLL
jgi:hypothetical protein